MNKPRRELLRKAILSLEAAEQIVERALMEEQDSLDNLPENLEGSEMYEKMENNADKMEEAISNIEEAVSCIEEAVL